MRAEKKKEKNSFLSFPLLLIALPAFALVSSCCAVDAARLPLSTTTHSSSVLSASSFAALATPCVVLIVWLATAHQPSFPLVFVIAIVRRPWVSSDYNHRLQQPSRRHLRQPPAVPLLTRFMGFGGFLVRKLVLLLICHDYLSRCHSLGYSCVGF